MDIWTERLERRHLPLLECWLGRDAGALTPQDLPLNAEELLPWFEMCVTEPGRLDCLVSVYETPVGLAGLRQTGEQDRVAVLYLLLGEVNYNPLRTATYVTLRMLDRAFSELRCRRVTAQVYAQHEWFLDVLDRMGFSRQTVQDDRVLLAVDKDMFQNRKYLF